MPSAVWDHFIKLDKINAKCRYCKEIFKTTNASTSSLTRHMQMKHTGTELKNTATTAR